MSAEFVLRNVAIYSLHVLIVTAAAALLMWAAGMRAPRVKLAFWHGVLALCLVLPVVEPWYQPPAAAKPGGVSMTSRVLGAVEDESAGRLAWPLSAAGTVFAALAAGGAIRVLLLAIGLVRLKRLESHSEPVPAGLEWLENARAAVGAAARFRYSEEITGPVTFGLSSPVVLLPSGFADLAPAEQEAVAIHELLHVRRRDWLLTLAEESVRAVLWFHPAVWFVLNRIQLAREQAVDEAVVHSTQRADEYIGALLKIAAARMEPDLEPAPLFLKRRHLRERVAAIVKGATMSRTRLVLTIIAMCSMLPLVVGVMAWQLPLQAAPQTPQDMPGVDVNTGYFKVLHRSGVEYPPNAWNTGEEGEVVARVTVDKKGEVVDARVVSSKGPQELRKAVLESVLGWHFSMDPVETNQGVQPVPESFEVAVKFSPGRGPALRRIEPRDFPASSKLWTIDAVDLSRLPADLRAKVEPALTLGQGQMARSEEVAAMEKAIREIDDHVRIAVSTSRGAAADHVNLVFSVLQSVPVQTAMAPALAPPKKLQPGPERIRVGGNAAALNLVEKIVPKYPPEAKEARIQGVVRLTALIGKDGRVQTLELVSGHPLLVPSTIEAVKQWVYKPTLLNGNPVEVITQIDVNYTLAE
jgi:TonB family protein